MNEVFYILFFILSLQVQGYVLYLELISVWIPFRVFNNHTWLMATVWNNVHLRAHVAGILSPEL